MNLKEKKELIFKKLLEDNDFKINLSIFFNLFIFGFLTLIFTPLYLYANQPQEFRTLYIISFICLSLLYPLGLHFYRALNRKTMLFHLLIMALIVFIIYILIPHPSPIEQKLKVALFYRLTIGGLFTVYVLFAMILLIIEKYANLKKENLSVIKDKLFVYRVYSFFIGPIFFIIMASLESVIERYSFSWYYTALCLSISFLALILALSIPLFKVIVPLVKQRSSKDASF